MSKQIIESLIKVAREAHNLCDGTEENDNGLFCDPQDFQKLSNALDLLDAMEEPPGECATGPRKAEYHLGNLAESTLDLYTDEFKRIRALDFDSEINALCERAIHGIQQRVPIIKQRDDLKSERDALKVELTEMTRLRDYAEKAWAKQRLKLLNQIDTIKARCEKLEGYAEHKDKCRAGTPWMGPPMDCTCGLGELRKQGEE